MEYYILLDHWGSLVRMFKDSEKEFEQDGYASEQVALAILDYIRYTRIRQYKLFQQKRGEEYERMFEILETKEHNLEAVRRFVEDDDLWKVTLELAEE